MVTSSMDEYHTGDTNATRSTYSKKMKSKKPPKAKQKVKKVSNRLYDNKKYDINEVKKYKKQIGE